MDDKEHKAEDDTAATADVVTTKCRGCADCHSRRGESTSSAPSWLHIPELQAVDDVQGFEGIAPRTDEQHIGDPDGILAHYDLNSDILCSLPGRHLHRRGIVVRMLCGIVLRMGFDCGSKSIEGFGDIKKDYVRRTQFERDERSLESWPTRFEGRIGLLKPLLEQRAVVFRTLCDRLTDLRNVLVRRYRDRDPRSLIVRVDQQELRLAGLQIFSAEQHSVEQLQMLLTRFRQQFIEHPPVDGDSAQILKGIAKRADRKADDDTEWVRETAHFVTETNLNLALRALGRSDSKVEYTDGGWLVSYFNGGGQRVFLPQLRSL